MCVYVTPVSDVEVKISYAFEFDPQAEIIPNTEAAITEWVENIGGGHQIDGRYLMDICPEVLSSAGHNALGATVAKVVSEYNRPHMVSFWIGEYGEATAARLEKKYFEE
jgi:hypothetical protein